MAFRILNGHTSPETAYIVESYPFGFKLRCKLRAWVESSPKKGYRFVTQTSNPKVEGLVWNKPKPSVYSVFGVMYLNDEEHVRWYPIHACPSPEFVAVFWGTGLAEQMDNQQRATFSRIVHESSLMRPGEWLEFNEYVSDIRDAIKGVGDDVNKVGQHLALVAKLRPSTTLDLQKLYPVARKLAAA